MSDLAASQEKTPPLARAGGRSAPRTGSGQTAPAEAAGGDFFAHYSRRIDPRVAASFSAEQREAIRTMFGDRGIAPHTIDLRCGFPLGHRRYYLVFLLGRDRRLSLRSLSGHRDELLGYGLLATVVLVPLFALIFGLRP
jgi:hypothetical protein